MSQNYVLVGSSLDFITKSTTATDCFGPMREINYVGRNINVHIFKTDY